MFTNSPYILLLKSEFRYKLKIGPEYKDIEAEISTLPKDALKCLFSKSNPTCHKNHTFLYAIFIVSRTLIYGVDVPGYASLLVAILFIGSLQLIGVGMLGEYIGRIYMETKNRPLYLIRRRYGERK